MIFRLITFTVWEFVNFGILIRIKHRKFYPQYISLTNKTTQNTLYELREVLKSYFLSVQNYLIIDHVMFLQKNKQLFGFLKEQKSFKFIDWIQVHKLNCFFTFQFIILHKMENPSSGEDHIQKMHQLALQSRSKAYCPYSNFAVGSCILGANGKFYTGCNVQKAVCSLCAQQTAIAKMVQDGCRQLKEVYVVTALEDDQLAAPCGYCRQYIKEFSHNDNEVKVHLGSVRKGYQKTFTFAYLFPMSFGPISLGKPLP